MAYGAPYNSPEEVYVRNLLINGDIATAQAFMRSPNGNVLINLPLRTPVHIQAIKQYYGLSIAHSNMEQPFIREMLRPLEQIDSLVIAEVKRCSSANWLAILFAAKLIARKPRQRLIAIENATTSQRFYTITCSSRQRLIEQIFDKRILPCTTVCFNGIMSSEFSSGPLGHCNRHVLHGDNIPKSWEFIYIRLIAPQAQDPLATAFASLGIN
jgi:hypothetical protein